MAINSGVTPGDIDKTHDRPLTAEEIARLERWISDAETLIDLRLPVGQRGDLDLEVLAMVVRMAVENRQEGAQSGGATAVSVQVDDGAVTRRYDNRKTGAAWWFEDGWWAWLSPSSAQRGAFSTRPSFEPDRSALS